ncbi:MAG TPA: nuclear transport factor 2 family protein [Solirubrobacteraceae bacterium]|nr:nuclear transport factor 2 family protein [Solirubrobacteraceae bacterium]
MAQEDLDRLREGYAAFNRGDFAAVLESVAPGFVLTDREELPDPGTYRGLEGAVQVFVGVSSDFDDYVIEPVEMVDGGDWVVVTARQSGTGKASGARVEGEVFHLWRLQDGKAVGLHAFSTRDEAFAAAEEPGWLSS